VRRVRERIQRVDFDGASGKLSIHLHPRVETPPARDGLGEAEIVS